MSPLGGEPGALAVAAAAAAAAAWAWTGPSGPASRLRGLTAGGESGRVPLTGRTGAAGHGSAAAPGRAAGRTGAAGRGGVAAPSPPWRGPGARVLGVLAAAAVVVVVVTGAGAVAGVALAVLVASAARHRRDVRGRRQRDDVLAEQAALCEALAAELRAGRPPALALRAAAGEGRGPGATAVRRAAAVADLGGDVAEALGLDGALPAEAVPSRVATGAPFRGATSRHPGRGRLTRGDQRHPEPDALVHLAACWRVTQTSGAALAPVVDRLAQGLRAQERQREELVGELTGARTTGRMLAVLPALGVLLAAAVGARPVEFLLGTPLGGACLLGALALDLAGLTWTGRLATRALASAR